MLKALLFDVDGVLLDSEELYFRAVRETFKPYGIEIGRDEYVKRWMIDQTCSPGVISDYNLNVNLDVVRARKAEIIDALIDNELEMIPHAMDMLRRFHGKYPLGVVSSADRREFDKKLGKFGLQTMFKVMVTSSDVKRLKPYPDSYQKGTELLGIEPRYVVAVEDNPSGVRSAKDAGCIAVAFPNGFTQYMNFDGADAVISSLAEINEDMLRCLF